MRPSFTAIPINKDNTDLLAENDLHKDSLDLPLKYFSKMMVSFCITTKAFVFVNARRFVRPLIVSPSRSNSNFEKRSLSILFGIKYGKHYFPKDGHKTVEGYVAGFFGSFGIAWVALLAFEIQIPLPKMVLIALGGACVFLGIDLLDLKIETA